MVPTPADHRTIVCGAMGRDGVIVAGEDAAKSYLRLVDEEFQWTTEEAEEKLVLKGIDDDYDEQEFYCRSVNKHDHSVVVNARMDPAVAGQIDALVSSGMIGHYRTKSDFVRDAIIHRLWFVSNKLEYTEELKAMLAVERGRVRLEQAKMFSQNIEAVLQAAESNINDASVRGDVHWLEQTRDSLLGQVDAMREPYKGKALGLVRRIDSVRSNGGQ